MQTFYENDIVNNDIVSEDNLDLLCQRVHYIQSYDKVGSEFYHIDKNMKLSTMNREPEYVLKWLRKVERLSSTSKDIGYLGRRNLQMKITCSDFLIGFLYDEIRSQVEKGETRFAVRDKIVSVLSDKIEDNVRVVAIEVR